MEDDNGKDFKNGCCGNSSCYSFNEVNDPYSSAELIGFSDASLEAYGCCVYFKYVFQSGKVEIAFVT